MSKKFRFFWLVLGFALLLSRSASALERGSIWLGLSLCEQPGTYFSLYLSAETGSVTGQLTGDFPPQGVKGSFVDGHLVLEPVNWLIKRPPRGERLKRLEATYHVEQNVLYGTVSGSECPNFIARRIDAPPGGDNQSGLLFTVPSKGNLRKAVGETECQAYARWLVDGSYANAPRGSAFNSALGKFDQMRQVLGRDIFDWTEQDGRMLAKIGSACRSVLRNSRQADSTTLADAIRSKGGCVPRPLKTSPVSNQSKAWQSLLIYLYADLYADLERINVLLKEGLAATNNAVASGDKANGAVADSRTDEDWVGLLGCTGGERYMRLSVDGRGPDVSARLETGSGLEVIYPRGALRLSGRFEEDQFRLEPGEWLHKPGAIGARAVPIGLEGKMIEDGQAIQGTVLGDRDCPEFRAYLMPRPRADLNPDGLLFKATGLRRAILNEADCRRFVGWLASGSEVSLGGYRYISLATDNDAMWDVLGKQADQWGEDDHTRFRAVSSTCHNMLRDTTDLEISDLLQKIVTWSPSPLQSSKDDWNNPRWLQLELLPIVSREAVTRSAADRDAAQALPVSLASFDRLDALIGEAKNTRGRLRYLTDAQRLDHLAALSASRRDLGLSIADATADRFRTFPATLDGLLALETMANETEAALRDRSAEAGAEKLHSGFVSEGQARGLVLWDDLLSRAGAGHAGLADADYTRFAELQTYRSEAEILERFANAANDRTLGVRYDAYRAADRKITLAMIKRSLPGILSWIEMLEPSSTANDAMKRFVEETFEIPQDLQTLPDLASAIAAKRLAYNPVGFSRPDIILALSRGHWREVAFRGFDNMAYMATSMRIMDKRCPAIFRRRVEPSFTALSSYSMSAAEDAMERLAKGEVTSRAEAERGVLMMANIIFNQPGCTVDFFGYPTSNCTTEAEQNAAFEEIMTSGEAARDMDILILPGCSTPAVSAFLEGYVHFVELHPFAGTLPSMNLPDLQSVLRAAK